jgi:hypothetical protein
MIYRWQIKLNIDKMEKILMTNKRQNLTKSHQPSSQNNGGIYEIKIKGLVDDHWRQWFEGMTLERHENAEAAQGYTLIIGLIVDQLALHGLLAKIRDLNLTLISVRKLDPKDPFNHGGAQNDAHVKSHRRSSHK